eukprot:scaffold1883_cov261-Pinguiococcus_pyrenoidosus.AAC.24
MRRRSWKSQSGGGATSNGIPIGREVHTGHNRLSNGISPEAAVANEVPTMWTQDRSDTLSWLPICTLRENEVCGDIIARSNASIGHHGGQWPRLTPKRSVSPGSHKSGDGERLRSFAGGLCGPTENISSLQQPTSVRPSRSIQDSLSCSARPRAWRTGLIWSGLVWIRLDWFGLVWARGGGLGAGDFGSELAWERVPSQPCNAVGDQGCGSASVRTVGSMAPLLHVLDGPSWIGCRRQAWQRMRRTKNLKPLPSVLPNGAERTETELDGGCQLLAGAECQNLACVSTPGV